MDIQQDTPLLNQIFPAKTAPILNVSGATSEGARPLTADSAGNVYYVDSGGLEKMSMGGGSTTLSGVAGMTVNALSYAKQTNLLYALVNSAGVDSAATITTAGVVKSIIPLPPPFSILTSVLTIIAVDGSTNTAYFAPYDTATGAWDAIAIANFSTSTVTTTPVAAGISGPIYCNIAVASGTLYYLGYNSSSNIYVLERVAEATLNQLASYPFPQTQHPYATNPSLVSNGLGVVSLLVDSTTEFGNVSYFTATTGPKVWSSQAVAGFIASGGPSGTIALNSGQNTGSPYVQTVTSKGVVADVSTNVGEIGPSLLNVDGNLWSIQSTANVEVDDFNALAVAVSPNSGGGGGPQTLVLSLGSQPGTIDVSENGGIPVCKAPCTNGPFSVTSANKAVATISYVGISGPSAQYSVTAVSTGSTTVTVADKKKNSVQIPTSVQP